MSKGPKFHGPRNVVSSSRPRRAISWICRRPSDGNRDNAADLARIRRGIGEVPQGFASRVSPKCEMAAFRTSSNMEHARERERERDGRRGVAWIEVTAMTTSVGSSTWLSSRALCIRPHRDRTDI